jgi:hypothetical protein
VGHDLALMVHGELNTFAPDVARDLLRRASKALTGSGVLILEVHTEQFVRELGDRPPSWFSAESSVFGDEPHLCLRESTWHPESRASVEEFAVRPVGRDEWVRYVSTAQAYSGDEYDDLLRSAGFAPPRRHLSLVGDADLQPGLFVLEARLA